MSAAAQARRLRPRDELESSSSSRGRRCPTAPRHPVLDRRRGVRPRPADRPHARGVRRRGTSPCGPVPARKHRPRRRRRRHRRGRTAGLRLPRGRHRWPAAATGRPRADADGVHGVHRLADGADIRATIAAGASGPWSSAAGTSGWRWPRCSRRAGCTVTVVLADPLPMAQLDDDMGGGSARPWATWASTSSPASRCARSRWTPTARSRRCAPTPAATPRPRRPRPRHGAGGVARGGGGTADRCHRRDRRRPQPAQPLAPGGLRRRRLRPDVPPDHRRARAHPARHPRQQAGTDRGLHDRRLPRPLRRRPRDGGEEGRRPRGRPDRLCTAQAEDGGYDSGYRADRGRRPGRLLPRLGAHLRSSFITERSSGLLFGAQVMAGRAAASGSTSSPPRSGPA